MTSQKISVEQLKRAVAGYKARIQSTQAAGLSSSLGFDAIYEYDYFDDYS